ncbi:MAG: phosphoribosylglycinamide formyltransferase, formyltetrahydrofolate-dependent [Candidatus Peregrinibacteria bacterium Greene0416_19]|nr:MAG: phosphoribosylglycinamide formyltransferase, formyltetrahydrofolate-dependent [Candidatus Peregrinibacteria bacterium Greene0416_19]
MHFVVLSSTRGTTFQAVIDAMKRGDLTAQCLGLVTDRPDRGCIGKAAAAGLPCRVVEKNEGESRKEYDKRVHAAIQDLSNEQRATSQQETIIAALGWMFIFSPWFISQWKDRIINIHPALLPKYGGENMYGLKVHTAVLAAGEKESGITIHLMDEGVDTGKILLQKTCPVEPGDTPDTLRERVQALEKEWYPKVLQMITSP